MTIDRIPTDMIKDRASGVKLSTSLADKQAKASTGTAAPTINATFIGQDFIDTANKKVYKAVAIGTGATDWVLLN